MLRWQEYDLTRLSRVHFAEFPPVRISLGRTVYFETLTYGPTLVPPIIFVYVFHSYVSKMPHFMLPI
jgi:hypothetical protein